MKRGVKTVLLTVAIFGGSYLSMGPMRFPEYLLTSGRATVEVTDLRDIPTECRSNTWSRHRSSEPGRYGDGFCGSIMTDHGDFQLPESRFYLFGQTRSEIRSALKEGCTYQFVYYGYHATVFKGMLSTNRYIPQLVRISDPINCSKEGQE